MSMPSYWFDPMVGGGGGVLGGIPNVAPAMSAAQINASMYGGYSPGAAQSTLNNIYGAGGFGAQPAYYAGLGAAYGRATGGFGGATPGGGGGGSVFDTGADPWNPYATQLAQQGGGGASPYAPGGFNLYGAPSSGSLGSMSPFGGYTPQPAYNPFSAYSAGGYNPFSAQSYAPAAQPNLGGGFGGRASAGAPVMAGGGIYGDQAAADRAAGFGASPYAQMFRMPDANPEYFNPGTYAGSQGNYGIPYNGMPQPGDIGFSRQSPMPNLGYNPGMQNWFANPGMGGGDFQGRFGMGFPNAGTPSQVMPQYGESLTAMDRLGVPHGGFRMDQQ